MNSKTLDAEGLYLPGSDDYKYYGCAKDLPKVRELFDKDKPQAPIRNYEDLNRKVGYEYFTAKVPAEIIQEEKQLEEKLRNQAMEEYKLKRSQYESTKRIKTDENEERERKNSDSEDIDDFEYIHGSSVIPLTSTNQIETKITADDIKRLILQKKKEALIRKYASEAMDDAQKDNNVNIFQD